MKRYGRHLIVAAAVAATVLLILYLFGEVSAPVSSLLGKERDRLVRSLKENGSPQGAAARDIEEKIEVLDYRLAMAYNAENRPDKAVAVLERLIRDEEAKAAGKKRSSRSYLREARYYETLADAYDLKRDDGEVMSAKHKRLELLSKAEDRKREEMLEEGRHVGTSSE